MSTKRTKSGAVLCEWELAAKCRSGTDSALGKSGKSDRATLGDSPRRVPPRIRIRLHFEPRRCSGQARPRRSIEELRVRFARIRNGRPCVRDVPRWSHEKLRKLASAERIKNHSYLAQGSIACFSMPIPGGKYHTSEHRVFSYFAHCE